MVPSLSESKSTNELWGEGFVGSLDSSSSQYRLIHQVWCHLYQMRKYCGSVSSLEVKSA